MSRPAPMWCTHCRTHAPHPAGFHTGPVMHRTWPRFLAVELSEPTEEPAGPEIEVQLGEPFAPFTLTAEECRALADGLMLAAMLADERTRTRCPACQHAANLTPAGLCIACEIATLNRPESD